MEFRRVAAERPCRVVDELHRDAAARGLFQRERRDDVRVAAPLIKRGVVRRLRFARGDLLVFGERGGGLVALALAQQHLAQQVERRRMVWGMLTQGLYSLLLLLYTPSTHQEVSTPFCKYSLMQDKHELHIQQS